MLKGPEIAARSGNTQRLVMFLHGLGADGADLLSLADMLDLPDTHFVAPNAPFPCDMAPYGYQWFSLLDRNPARMLAGIQVAAPLLDTFIDAQMARFSLAPSQVALVGFSQGTMMSLYTAPHRAQPLAGVVGFSGALLGAELLAAEVKAKPPVCLIHGTADEVVPFGAMAHAEDALKAAGLPVEAHARPHLGHGIDEVAIDLAAAFLRTQFGLN